MSRIKPYEIKRDEKTGKIWSHVRSKWLVDIATRLTVNRPNVYVEAPNRLTLELESILQSTGTLLGGGAA